MCYFSVKYQRPLPYWAYLRCAGVAIKGGCLLGAPPPVGWAATWERLALPWHSGIDQLTRSHTVIILTPNTS